jgi:hypothetical protein
VVACRQRLSSEQSTPSRQDLTQAQLEAVQRSLLEVPGFGGLVLREGQLVANFAEPVDPAFARWVDKAHEHAAFGVTTTRYPMAELQAAMGDLVGGANRSRWSWGCSQPMQG